MGLMCSRVRASYSLRPNPIRRGTKAWIRGLAGRVLVANDKGRHRCELNEHASAAAGNDLVVDVDNPPGAWLNNDASIVDDTILISACARELGHEPIRQRMEVNRSGQVASNLGVKARVTHGAKVLACRVLLQDGAMLRGKAQGPVRGAVVRRRHMDVLRRSAPGKTQRKQSSSHCQDLRCQSSHCKPHQSSRVRDIA